MKVPGAFSVLFFSQWRFPFHDCKDCNSFRVNTTFSQHERGVKRLTFLAPFHLDKGGVFVRFVIKNSIFGRFAWKDHLCSLEKVMEIIIFSGCFLIRKTWCFLVQKDVLSLEGNMLFAEQETDSQRLRKSSSFLAPFRASFPFQKYKGKYSIFTTIFLHVF